jgi:tRNA A-37 threonylcarbamoyl transferase component Bud32
MPIGSLADLVATLRKGRLLEPAQLRELPPLQTSSPDPQALARELVRRGWLTPYQVNALFQGRGHELLLGSYVLLDKLGEGGMGQVFKARNWKLGQVVALKLIRKERLTSADAVRRFHREIRAAAQLDHPNVVRAYDADEIGGTHLLVMEYAEGTDLARAVRGRGPLPVAEACEYVRQAALGLQHVHERGLVHRDIKPSNLLVSGQGAVKVLDLGLALLTASEEDRGESAALTREGALMGTADYMAPEQAQESHAVDIRADLYSLGCTLYFLLAGRPPFPTGTFLQKLNKHQFEEPAPLEHLRPDLPPGLAAVIRKALAKRPGDRYQTPAELAAALAALPAGGAEAFDHDAPTVAEVPGVTGQDDPAPARAGHLAPLAGDSTLVPVSGPAARRAAERRRQVLFAAAGGAVSLALAGVLLLLLLRLAAPPAPPAGRPATDPDAGPPSAAWLRQVGSLRPDQQVAAVAAKLKELNPGFDGRVAPTLENGVITRCEFLADRVTDLTPVRALAGLKSLTCTGSAAHPGDLSDLGPLRGLPLTYLNCSGTKVADLSPLKGMPLTALVCSDCQVSDLGPLRGMPLTYLNCAGTKVADLSPVRGMPLTSLQCGYTPVSDLSPLRGLPLTALDCYGTRVADLAPLQGLRLTRLACGGTRVADLSPLKGMPLNALNCAYSDVADLSALETTPLTSLSCGHSRVVDLTPLKALPLKELDCDFQPGRDAEVLRSIRTLETLNGRPVAEALKGAGAPP